MAAFVAYMYNLYKKEDIRIYLLGMPILLSRFVYNSKHLHENMVGTEQMVPAALKQFPALSIVQK